MFCSQRRDDWVKWLPIAEFAFNSRTHSATGHSPFFLMYGYQPEFHIPVLETTVPSADERREDLRKAREDATAAIALAAERMKQHFDCHVRDTPTLNVGQKVWLDTRNLQISGLPQKLVDRFAGPYSIKWQISPLAYELTLPKDLKIHLVVHVSLLSPHHTSSLPGRHPPEPAPLDVEGEEEYEVEEVLDSRRYGRWRKLQYLVRWKGWGPEHDSWEAAEDLTNAPDLVKKFYTKFPKAPKP